jgi:hypothetical protein
MRLICWVLRGHKWERCIFVDVRLTRCNRCGKWIEGWIG